MYDRILVPTDGSDPAAAAIEEAIELAAQNDAELHALYVVEPIPLGGFSAGAEPASAEWGDVVEEQRDEGTAATADIAEQARDHGLEVVDAIEHGKPNVQILEYADEHDIDAIVMGTHGRSGADRLVLGSVTEKVVRKSDVPVLTVRME
ncbi:universal stress protein [Natronorubrum thiooxidans]|uniref:Nucleotide-binding universal stress protein, UspA family n=1 Tax=Natronorubrum thiooxidans TaxID=308853 RepID=A0A1N7C285_9EURY|nr:universal stress protein [Natronorubrum thiooxidans]SIR57563.1 Nucleotide-binding universal stress protein, UspA family [Natronorubrum thiooxidans]